METTITLVAALLVFRGLAVLGVRRFASWPVSAAHALAVMTIMAAAAHFAPADVTVMPNHADLARMVPPFIPFAGILIYVTGVLEILGALGLIISKTRWAAGVCMTALFILLLPANVYAAVAEVPFHGGQASPLWLRIPQQVLYIGFALWAMRGASMEWPAFLRPWSARFGHRATVTHTAG
jgi:uncharacterized membrane protein